MEEFRFIWAGFRVCPNSDRLRSLTIPTDTETNSCTWPFDQPLGCLDEAQVVVPAVSIVSQFKDG
jgi:hypothetical protein